MDKIFSARMNELTVAQLEILALTLKTSKKAVSEHCYSRAERRDRRKRR